jgi:hypothetical protein
VPEKYPKTIHKLPTHIGPDNHVVLAWATMKNRHGNYPSGYVLAHNPAEVQPYVVWLAYTSDGGETWNASGGSYWNDFDNALEEFTERLGDSDIAREALTEPDPEPLWRRIGRMTDNELAAVLETEDDSSELWDAANDELEKRDEQRAANNGAMNGVAPEF